MKNNMKYKKMLVCGLSFLIMYLPIAFKICPVYAFDYRGEHWWFGNPTIVPYNISLVGIPPDLPPANFIGAVLGAAGAWSAVAKWNLDYIGLTDLVPGVNDGVNVVGWQNMTEVTEYYKVPIEGAAPLAVAYVWFDLVGLPPQWVIVEADIAFNSKAPWSTALPVPMHSFDVQSVAVHEFGHWVKLYDIPIWPPTAVMCQWISRGENRRALFADDIDGVQTVYGSVGGVGGVVIPVDKFGLLAPYIGLASTITVASVATAVYVKHAKRRRGNEN